VQNRVQRALGLLFALSAVSCGPSSEVIGDRYQGFIDGSVLDSKFLPGLCAPSTTARCYQAQNTSSQNSSVLVYNLGLVATSAFPSESGRPYLPVERVTATSYDFPEGCQAPREYDVYKDAFHPDQQYSAFTQLPLATTSSSAPAVLPLVKVVRWTGTGSQPCNAIKSATSLERGDFGGQAEEDSSIALRAIIDMTQDFRAPQSVAYAPSRGWFRALQFSWLNGGTAPVENGRVKTMDGVLVNPATGTPSAVTANNVLVLQARPGEANWSPVVLLRTFAAPAGQQPSSFRSLCYTAPDCPAGSIDITRATTLSGLLFLVGVPQ
jgi:hypothetical protein